jgi:hypothetical protein
MQIFKIVKRDNEGGYIRVEPPFDAKKLRRDLLKGKAFLRSENFNRWCSLYGEDWEKAVFVRRDNVIDFLKKDVYRQMLAKNAETDPAVAVYLALFDERGLVALLMEMDFQELRNLALQIIKDDSFFGPITKTYGDDFGVSYIVREEGHICDDHNLLFKMKLTAIEAHLFGLGQSECYAEGATHHDPEMWDAYQGSRELDKDTDAFIARFVAHFAKDDPMVHAMFAVATARGPSGINVHDLMQWVLRWSETTRRDLDRMLAKSKAA